MMQQNLGQSLLSQQDDLFLDVLASKDAPDVTDIEDNHQFDSFPDDASTATEDEFDHSRDSVDFSSHTNTNTVSNGNGNGNAGRSSTNSNNTKKQRGSHTRQKKKQKKLRSSSASSPSDQQEGPQLQPPSSFPSVLWKSLSLCCSCSRSKREYKQKVVTCATPQAAAAAQQRREEQRKQRRREARKLRDRKLRERLLKSQKYAAYLKECHATLLQRLTSDEGKKLIRRLAQESKKPVSEVVEHLVKGLEATAIRQYIKTYKGNRKKAKEAEKASTETTPVKEQSAQPEQIERPEQPEQPELEIQQQEEEQQVKQVQQAEAQSV